MVCNLRAVQSSEATSDNLKVSNPTAISKNLSVVSMWLAAFWPQKQRLLCLTPGSACHLSGHKSMHIQSARVPLEQSSLCLATTASRQAVTTSCSYGGHGEFVLPSGAFISCFCFVFHPRHSTSSESRLRPISWEATVYAACYEELEDPQYG